jgi:hypothetical protein
VCAEESPEQIRGEMKKFGLDASSVKGNQMMTIVNYDEVYIVNGKVDIPEIIGKFSNMVDASKAARDSTACERGQRCRAFSNMTW